MEHIEARVLVFVNLSLMYETTIVWQNDTHKFTFKIYWLFVYSFLSYEKCLICNTFNADFCFHVCLYT